MCFVKTNNTNKKTTFIAQIKKQYILVYLHAIIIYQSTIFGKMLYNKRTVTFVREIW